MIYFFRSGETVKIGYTNNPYRRLSAIQTGCHNEVEVLFIGTGGRVKEHELHLHFQDERLRGEWYRYGSAIKEYIEARKNRDRQYEFGICYHDFEGDEQLFRLRKSNNLLAIEVAERLNISQQAVSAIEHREKDGSVTLKNMKRFAAALGYKFEYRFTKL